jgi:hypothetical protein
MIYGRFSPEPSRRIDPETPILPHAIAEGVCEKASVWLGQPLPCVWMTEILAHANDVSAHNARSHDRVRGGGDAECAAKLKKRTLTNLYNERPAWLDLAHKKLDAAVAVAYGWPADLSDEQILEKLLALNLERAAEEAKAAKAREPKAQRAKGDEELL